MWRLGKVQSTMYPGATEREDCSCVAIAEKHIKTTYVRLLSENRPLLLLCLCLKSPKVTCMVLLRGACFVTFSIYIAGAAWDSS